MDRSINPVKRVKSIELSGFVLTEFLQPPLLKSPSHFHDCATILLTLKGFAADGINNRVYECQPSKILIRPAGEKHTHHYGREGLQGLVVEVKNRKLETIRSFSSVLNSVGNFNDAFLSKLGTRLYVESKIMDSASELAIEGLMLEMLAHLTRQDLKNSKLKALPRWLKQAIEFIHESYAQTISLSQIAAQIGVHPTHLAEVFRQFTGCSVGEYIRRLRLDYAAREVLFSEDSLAEISLKAGFYDQSHFTKFFKRSFGISPNEMRVLARSSESDTKSLRLSKTHF